MPSPKKTEIEVRDFGTAYPYKVLGMIFRVIRRKKVFFNGKYYQVHAGNKAGSVYHCIDIREHQPKKRKHQNA